MSYTPPRDSPPPLPHSRKSSPLHNPADQIPNTHNADDSDSEIPNTIRENYNVGNTAVSSFYTGNPMYENAAGFRGVLSDDEEDAMNRMEMDDEMHNDDDEVNNHHRYNDDDDDDDDGDLGVRSGPRGGILSRGGDMAMGSATGGAFRSPNRPSNFPTGPGMGYMSGAGIGRTSEESQAAMSNIPLSSPDHTAEMRGGFNVGRTDPRSHSHASATQQAARAGTGNGQTLTSPHSKLDTLRNWSFNTYKFTRQVLSEKLGRVSRTVDTELESQIELLRDTQLKYNNILRLTQTLAQHFNQMAQTQRSLSEAFTDLSQKNPELREEFSYNAETQRVLYRNGETLLASLQFFTSTMNTLCNKTMDDTLITIKQYEAARVEYDAYRLDLEYYGVTQGGAPAPPRDADTTHRYEETKKLYEAHKEKYERLRSDVTIKMKFLDENRVKVMHKQLLLLHNTIASYFSGNQTALQETLKQFNIKLKTPNSDKPSWIESHSPS